MSGASSTFAAPSDVLGTKIFLTEEQTSTPTVEQTFISFTVGANLQRKIYSVTIDARVEGRCKILHGTDLIASFRTGPGAPTGTHVFQLPYVIPSGDLFEVKFLAVQGTPANVDLACFVQLTEVDT